METIVKLVGGLVLVAGTIFALACLNGTILYYVYPHIFAMFPKAAEAGVIAPTIEWWDAVCVTWIFGILIKSSSTSSSSKEK